jgi:hypothetical protein
VATACGSEWFHHPPPKAWQKRGRIAQAVRPGLHEGEKNLLISLRRSEQHEITDVTQIVFSLRDAKNFLGGLRCIGCGGQTIGIGRDRMQRICDVLKSGEYALAVLRLGLKQALVGRALPVQ